MSFDDDKVRKNLVVAGATVIATHYLGLPIYDIFIDKLGLGKYLVDRIHLTQIGLSVFVYLGLMFRFSAAGKEYAHRIAEDSTKVEKNRSLRWATNGIRRLLSEGTKPKWRFKESLWEQLDRALEKKPPGARKGPDKVFVHYTDSGSLVDPSKYRASISIFWSSDASISVNDVVEVVDIELTRVGVLMLRVGSFLERHLYTETAIMVLLPVLLGNAAVILMVYRLLGQYLGSA